MRCLYSVFIIMFHICLSGLSDQERLIVDHYTPSQEFCRAAINPDVYIPGINDNERELTCLLMGFRNVISVVEPFLKRVMDQTPSNNEAFEALKKVLKEKIDTKQIHIAKGPHDIFLYNNAGKENAQLLLKQDEERLPNPYLYGFLLGYRESDIDFFYKIGTFQGENNWKLPHSAEFYFWPKELKDKFYSFEKNVWPKLDACKKYADDKKNAQLWIKKAKSSK